jgi:hypothetical protein
LLPFVAAAHAAEQHKHHLQLTLTPPLLQCHLNLVQLLPLLLLLLLLLLVVVSLLSVVVLLLQLLLLLLFLLLFLSLIVVVLQLHLLLLPLLHLVLHHKAMHVQHHHSHQPCHHMICCAYYQPDQCSHPLAYPRARQPLPHPQTPNRSCSLNPTRLYLANT